MCHVTLVECHLLCVTLSDQCYTTPLRLATHTIHNTQFPSFAWHWITKYNKTKLKTVSSNCFFFHLLPEVCPDRHIYIILKCLETVNHPKVT